MITIYQTGSDTPGVVINDTPAQTTTPAIQPLRKVEWTSIWNRSLAHDTDGYGSKAHLTSASGLTGKTLCGRAFPADKGNSSNTGGFCKACCNKAYKMGYAKGFTKELAWVPSKED